jgi:ubiquinone/menaquinone biosynthesis C-methylase UbiE
MTMRRPAFIARQSSRPTGWIGRLLARIMAKETRAVNEDAVRALAVAPGDRVLEIGFGHGRTIARIAETAPGTVVDGLDVSADMVRLASRRCAALVDAGRVRLRAGDSSRLPYDGASFDKVLAVHTLYFWPDPIRDLREIRRVMRPGGAFVLAFKEKSDDAVRSFPPPTYRFHLADEAIALLRSAGFDHIAIERTGAGKGVVLARASVAA